MMALELFSKLIPTHCLNLSNLDVNRPMVTEKQKRDGSLANLHVFELLNP